MGDKFEPWDVHQNLCHITNMYSGRESRPNRVRIGPSWLALRRTFQQAAGDRPRAKGRAAPPDEDHEPHQEHSDGKDDPGDRPIPDAAVDDGLLARIVGKIEHITETRDDRVRGEVKKMLPNAEPIKVSVAENILEIASSLNMIHKIVRHYYLLGKKTNSYILLVQLQMIMPQVLMEADALINAVDTFKLGQPVGGFPKALQKRVLRDRKPLRGRPGAALPPADFQATRTELEKQFQRPVTEREVVTHLLYPRVFPDLANHQAKYSDTSVLPTPTFFFGMQPGDEISVEIEPGKTLIVKFLATGDPHEDGRRQVFFELNGQPREVMVLDKSLASEVRTHPKAEVGNPRQAAAPMPGLVVSVVVAAGEQVAAGQKLLTLEAMKMESTVYAEVGGIVAEVLVRRGTQVEMGDLLVRLA